MMEYLNELLHIATAAGNAIMDIYNKENINVEYKKDHSPLTEADKAAHHIIVEGLQRITPNIPIISEEGKAVLQHKVHQMNTFWCVDPLDGTKEFIKRNGEFTVNIALIKNARPVLGIVYAPALATVYYGAEGLGSFKKEKDRDAVKIFASTRKSDLVAVGSRSHKHEDEALFLQNIGATKIIEKGSSLKFCLVAEGLADVYYRHGPTMEWDTAAGHAVVLYAGGSVQCLNNENFVYGKSNMLNTGFICKSASI